jgi:hypothetical protein
VRVLLKRLFVLCLTGSFLGVFGVLAGTSYAISNESIYAGTKSFNTTNGTAAANGVAVDSQGNEYVAGDFTGTDIFGGGQSLSGGGAKVTAS